MKPYVITGGPGVGKTTTIELLRQKGYAVVPEAARMIIEEESLKGGEVLPWKSLPRFQQAVAQRQLRHEAAKHPEITFLDRSLVDGYAYCMLGKIPVPELVLNHGRNRYERVFLLERLEVYVTDQDRIEDERLALAIHDEIRKAYAVFGYEPVSVPVLSPEARVQFILDRILEKKEVNVPSNPLSTTC